MRNEPVRVFRLHSERSLLPVGSDLQNEPAYPDSNTEVKPDIRRRVAGTGQRSKGATGRHKNPAPL